MALGGQVEIQVAIRRFGRRVQGHGRFMLDECLPATAVIMMIIIIIIMPHHRPISCHLFVSSCLLWLDVVEVIRSHFPLAFFCILMLLYFWISSLSCLFSKLLPNHPSKSESLRMWATFVSQLAQSQPGDQPIRRHSFLFQLSQREPHGDQRLQQWWHHRCERGEEFLPPGIAFLNSPSMAPGLLVAAPCWGPVYTFKQTAATADVSSAWASFWSFRLITVCRCGHRSAAVERSGPRAEKWGATVMAQCWTCWNLPDVWLFDVICLHSFQFHAIIPASLQRRASLVSSRFYCVIFLMSFLRAGRLLELEDRIQ